MLSYHVFYKLISMISNIKSLLCQCVSTIGLNIIGENKRRKLPQFLRPQSVRYTVIYYYEQHHNLWSIIMDEGKSNSHPSDFLSDLRWFVLFLEVTQPQICGSMKQLLLPPIPFHFSIDSLWYNTNKWYPINVKQTWSVKPHIMQNNSIDSETGGTKNDFILHFPFWRSCLLWLNLIDERSFWNDWCVLFVLVVCEHCCV